MRNSKSEFVVISIVQGEVIANILKSHLESEGIPVLLKWESVGRVFGLTVDGLGQVKILVPEEFTDEAKHIIEARESPEDTE
ncbi:MAG: DUF2007 domain-containing protein [Dehalococcoidia bacterium]|nr:DUF2007 domain-containing protein [Dehalococcoidia bacterium]